jgi:hypothetical protein
MAVPDFTRGSRTSSARANRALRRGVALTAAFSLLANVACFSYRTALGGLHAGEDVMLELTADGTLALAQALGARVRVVEGYVREVGADGVALVVPERLTTVEGASALPPSPAPVRIPREYAASAQLRTFDRRKSWVVAAVLGTAFVTVVVLAIQKAKSHPTSGDIFTGGSTPDIRH